MRYCLSTWNYLVNYEPDADLVAAAEEIINGGFGLELFLNWDPEPAFFDRKNWPMVNNCFGGRIRLSLHSAVTKSFSARAIREEIDLCRYLGAELLVVHPISLGIQAGTLELCPAVELRDEDLRRISGIFRYAEQREVILALENGTLDTLKWVRDRLKEETGLRSFRICIDTGHANLHRERDRSYLVRLLEEFRNELVQVHISDNFGSKDDHGLPGAGNIDWPEVSSTLKSINFHGPYVFELRTPPPRQSAVKAREFMEQLLAVEE
jgi:sugar phosphate isomerase/epimerase